MDLVWGLLTRCSVTAHLIQEIFATWLPEAQLQIFSSEQEAKCYEGVQAWIWDETALEAWKWPFLFLGAAPKEAPLGGDVLEKPFKLEQFLKHLQQISNACASSYSLGFYTFYPQKRLLQGKDGKTVMLREKETELLLFLLQSPGQKADKQTILNQVWGYHPQTLSHTLETHIYQLRQKLEDDPSNPAILINEEAFYSIALAS
ncbi:MAG: winged helix-turn-helix domain-containing protein [Alphaproteobacteria bacterium]